MAEQKFHCNQAIAIVGQEKLGKSSEEIIWAMGSLAGGFAVLGLCYSRAHQAEKENTRMWADAAELVRRFRDEILKQNGSIFCREISCMEWKNREQVKVSYKSDRVKDCMCIVGETAMLVGELPERF